MIVFYTTTVDAAECEAAPSKCRLQFGRVVDAVLDLDLPVLAHSMLSLGSVDDRVRVSPGAG